MRNLHLFTLALRTYCAQIWRSFVLFARIGTDYKIRARSFLGGFSAHTAHTRVHEAVIRAQEMLYPYDMNQQQIIEKHLKAATDRAFWLGIILGLIVGLIVGFIAGVFVPWVFW